jgi:hypothetical protein
MFNLTIYSNLISVLEYNPDTGIFNWLISPKRGIPAGSVAGFLNNGYIQISYKRKHYNAHTLAWLYCNKNLPSGILDHIDCNKSNNRISNLRIVDHTLNRINTLTRHDNTSGYKGVSYDKKSKKWRAQINHDKQRIYLGVYESPEEAFEAYCEIGKELYGEHFNNGEKND